MSEFFPKIFGNENSKNRIGDAITRNKLPHAILIDGPLGSGKFTFAKEIAKALNCENRGKDGFALPCNKCNTCRRIEEGNFLDFSVLEKESDKATIGIKAVREFRSKMFLSPSESEHQIFVIKDAEKLTVESQNALLKVLEEPPSTDIIMLLTTSSDKILTTVKSRTQYIAMSRFEKLELSSYMKNLNEDYRRVFESERQKFDEAIQVSQGCIGAAIKNLNPKSMEKNHEDRERILDIVRAMGSSCGFRDLTSAFGFMQVSKKRPDVIEALEEILLALRDMVVVKQSRDADTLFFISRDEALNYGQAIGQKRIFKIYSYINEAHSDLSKNANIGTIITNLVANIKFS